MRLSAAVEAEAAQHSVEAMRLSAAVEAEAAQHSVEAVRLSAAVEAEAAQPSVEAVRLSTAVEAEAAPCPRRPRRLCADTLSPPQVPPRAFPSSDASRISGERPGIRPPPSNRG